MKKFLPTSKGFTLIELMVVIAIIAILAVVGFTVFSGAQGQARDGVRRSEIDGLAKSIETSKDPATGIYAYTVADFNKDFPTNKPHDPTSARSYCIATDASTTPAPPAVATTNAATGCPTGGGATYTVINTTTPTGIPLPASTTSWTLCASLERGATPFCIQSLQR